MGAFDDAVAGRVVISLRCPYCDTPRMVELVGKTWVCGCCDKSWPARSAKKADEET